MHRIVQPEKNTVPLPRVPNGQRAHLTKALPRMSGAQGVAFSRT